MERLLGRHGRGRLRHLPEPASRPVPFAADDDADRPRLRCDGRVSGRRRRRGRQPLGATLGLGADGTLPGARSLRQFYPGCARRDRRLRQPSDLSVGSVTENELALSWSPATDNVGVVAYDVYMNGTEVASVTSTSFTQGGLVCDSMYWFGVEARDAAGNRSPRVRVNTTTTACAAGDDKTPPTRARESRRPGRDPDERRADLEPLHRRRRRRRLRRPSKRREDGVRHLDLVRPRRPRLRDLLLVRGCGPRCRRQPLGSGTRERDDVRLRASPPPPAPADGSAPPPPPDDSPPEDESPPTQPGNLAVSGATRTSVSLTWNASTDNVGVAGYRVYVNGIGVLNPTQPGATVTALSLWYRVHLRGGRRRRGRQPLDSRARHRFDGGLRGHPGADRADERRRVLAHGDQHRSHVVRLDRQRRRDRLRPLPRRQAWWARPRRPPGIFSGLTCNTNYTLAVDAVDAAGNRSAKATVMVATTACADTMPPSVAHRSRRLQRDPVQPDAYLERLDATTSASPATTCTGTERRWRPLTSTSSNQSGLACGTSYWFGVEALDAAGNRSPRSHVSATTTGCAPPQPFVGAFDTLGNSFPGENYNHVPHGAQDLAVAPDGVAVTGANWIESGHEVRVYDSSRVYGARTGIHDGIGARAVTITNSHVYAVHGAEIIRWPRSSFMAGDAYLNRITRNAGVTLHGIAVIGTEVYVSDLTAIRVFPADLSGGQIRQFPAMGARLLTADRQGNLWALTHPKIARYSPTGALLTEFTPSGDVLDIAADPTSDTILCADNGRDQQVKRYSYTGSLVSALGVQNGYLAGPTPGLLRTRALCRPTRSRSRFAGERLRRANRATRDRCCRVGSRQRVRTLPHPR